MELGDTVPVQVRRGMLNFLADKSGNIGLIFAAVLVPIVGAVGMAIDLGRASALRSHLQYAADAAMLAAGSQHALSEQQLEALAQGYMAANGGAPSWAKNVAFTVTKTDDGVTISARASVGTTFMTVLGMHELDVDITSGVAVGSGKLEVALVLDNTGSMRDHMADLRDGARDLVDKLFASAGQPGDLKIAVVPYVGAVNIGTSDGQMAWMDVNADGRWHGNSFEGHWTLLEADVAADWSAHPECHPAGGGGGGGDPDPGSGGGGDDRTNLLLDATRDFASLIGQVLGLGTAHAAGSAPLPTTPSGYTRTGNGNPADCYAAEPPQVNHFTLFNLLGVDWKGCVEARPAPYDVDDTPPDLNDPDTLFVPYFWADDADADVLPDLANNYLEDGEASLPSQWAYGWDDGRTRATIKYYFGNVPTLDETAPVTLGPNQACPDPILPLTSDRNQVVSAINNMMHWEGSGTVASEGIAWGWRVLSPTVPFTEGAPYGEARKVIVLMTDGKNWAAEQNNDSTWTDYTAYGFLRWGRIPVETYEGYKDHINARMLAACNNAKAAGVIIYTITFGNLDSATESLYEQCATEPPYHFQADTAEEMVRAFRNIGGQLSELRLTH